MIYSDLLRQGRQFASNNILVTTTVRMLTNRRVSISVSTQARTSTSRLTINRGRNQRLRLLSHRNMIRRTLTIPLLRLRTTRLILRRQRMNRHTILGGLRLTISNVTRRPNTTLNVNIMSIIIGIKGTSTHPSRRNRNTRRLEHRRQVNRVTHINRSTRVRHFNRTTHGNLHTRRHFSSKMSRGTNTQQVKVQRQGIRALIKQGIIISRRTTNHHVNASNLTRSFRPQGNIRVRARRSIHVNSNTNNTAFNIILRSRSLLSTLRPIRGVKMFIQGSTHRLVSRQPRHLNPYRQQSRNITIKVNIQRSRSLLVNKNGRFPRTFRALFQWLRFNSISLGSLYGSAGGRRVYGHSHKGMPG